MKNLDGLVDESLKNRFKVPALGVKNAIYFLLDGEEIVYIGQSRGNVLGRLADHYRSEKRFDSFSFMVVPGNAENLTRTEAVLILVHQPKYNETMPAQELLISEAKACKMLSISKRRFQRAIAEHWEWVRDIFTFRGQFYFWCGDIKEIGRRIES